VNPTWDWLIVTAAWVFLIGTVLVAISAVPAIRERYPRLLVVGFLMGIASFVMVLAAWALPRLPSALGVG
jgi:hypothetical protein